MTTTAHPHALDPRFTFESLVVGIANRLAHAAALRVASAPGAAYNPLFLYGASGLGKTHLLMAIGNRAASRKVSRQVRYESLEHLLDAATVRGGDAERAQVRERLCDADLLLLDDAQFLEGRLAAQEELLAVWDRVAGGGGQIVLASDRPPSEIEALDRRLLSRIAGGLVADLSPPEHATRVEIVTRRANERGHSLGPGVADVLAKVAFSNVRELQGGLNRVLAVQELESRPVAAEEVSQLLGLTIGRTRAAEFDTFLSEISGAIGEVLERLSPEQRLADAILRWEAEGYRVHRLERALSEPVSSDRAKALVAAFESDAVRLQDAARRIRALDPHAPELAREDVLRDPDRAVQAELLVARAEERLRREGATPAPADAAGAVADLAAVPAQDAASELERLIDAAERGEPTDDEASGAGEAGAAGAAGRIERGPEVVDAWFLSTEKVLWGWPYLEDWIVTRTAAQAPSDGDQG